jgi:hypothetical protein
MKASRPSSRYLVGVADDRRARARAGAADPGPQVGLDVAVVVGQVAQLGLAGVTCRTGVQRPSADALSGAGFEAAGEPARGGAGLVLGASDDHMRAVAKAQMAAVALGAGAHVGDRLGDAGQRVGPHEEDVGSLGSHLAGVLREAAEVQRRATVRRADTRRIEGESEVVAMEVDR